MDADSLRSFPSEGRLSIGSKNIPRRRSLNEFLPGPCKERSLTPPPVVPAGGMTAELTLGKPESPGDM